MKYSIENNIDFFSELYKSLNEVPVEDESNICLITKEPLIENFVTLQCGHKFNYIPLYKDLVNFKKKHSYSERSIKPNELRCPYCRKIHVGLLPYYEDLSLNKAHGVNYIDPNAVHNYNYMKIQHCEYLIPNNLFNHEIEESNINIKHFKCGHYAYESYSAYQEDSLSELYGDTKKYCYNHYKKVLREYKKKEKENAKKKEKELKLKIKEDEKKAKQEAKQKEKEEKEQAKQKEKEEKIKLKVNKNIPKKKIITKAKNEKNDTIVEQVHENIVLGSSNIDINNNDLSVQECCYIFKAGLKKGTKCVKNKVIESDFCKEHIKMKKNHMENYK